jgi:hypothetical protein
MIVLCGGNEVTARSRPFSDEYRLRLRLPIRASDRFQDLIAVPQSPGAAGDFLLAPTDMQQESSRPAISIICDRLRTLSLYR